MARLTSESGGRGVETPASGGAGENRLARAAGRTWRARDPVSCYSHLAGAFLSVVGLVCLIVAARGNPWRVIGFSVYGTTLILLYTASTTYHWLSLAPHRQDLLKRLDHVAIFLLIAGTYTPVCLTTLRGGWGWSVFGVVWALATAGATLKLSSAHLPRWPSTALYLVMGWVAIVAVVPLVRSLPLGGLAWLLAGGILYTLGGVVYATRRPDPLPDRFGFHEIFHFFVLGGSILHFVFMLLYVAPTS